MIFFIYIGFSMAGSTIDAITIVDGSVIIDVPIIDDIPDMIVCF